MDYREYSKKTLNKIESMIGMSKKPISELFNSTTEISNNVGLLKSTEEKLVSAFTNHQTLIKKTSTGYEFKVLVENEATKIWTPGVEFTQDSDLEEIIKEVQSWISYLSSKEYIEKYESSSRNFTNEVIFSQQMNNTIIQGLLEGYPEGYEFSSHNGSATIQGILPDENKYTFIQTGNDEIKDFLTRGYLEIRHKL